MSEYVKIMERKSVQPIVAQAFSGAPVVMLETMDLRHARMVLDMPTYVIVDTLTPDTPLDAYPSGRIFDETGQLKWQKSGATYQIEYIGNGFQENEGVQAVELCEPNFIRLDEDKTVVLLGEKVARRKLKAEMGFEAADDIFIEGSIPQYLKYPVSTTERGRVQIQVREYYDQTGHLEYYRFVKVMSVK